MNIINSLKHRLYNRIKTIILKAISPEEIIAIKEKNYISVLLKKVMIGEGSALYKETVIENFSTSISNIQIGNGSHIRGELLVFPYGGKIEIGNNCFIGEGTKLWSGDHIKIGNHVGIAHNINIVDFAHESNHLLRAQGVKNIFLNGHPKEKGDIPSAPIIIEDYVAIYPNASILRGVTIGKGSIISTGSVVMSNIPEFSLVVGNPARVVGKTE
jgi:acetyltransferase-like isoleucine patch superfamily enzyme